MNKHIEEHYSSVLQGIERVICAFLGIKVPSIHSSSRVRAIVDARHLIFYFMKKLYPKTPYRFIGDYYDRNHDTAMHGVKTIKSRLTVERDLVKEVGHLDILLEPFIDPTELDEVKNDLTIFVANAESVEEIYGLREMLDEIASGRVKEDVEENVLIFEAMSTPGLEVAGDNKKAYINGIEVSLN